MGDFDVSTLRITAKFPPLDPSDSSAASAGSTPAKLLRPAETTEVHIGGYC
jgi:hypothetical protein